MTGAAGAHPPLGDLAFLSDCRTSALIGPDASVVWLCAPRFDSPSVFARLLDRAGGGAWETEVEGAGPPEQEYAGDTLVLRGRWTTPTGSAVAHDFLAARPPEGDDVRGLVPEGMLVRLLTCERGRVLVRHRLDARPDYARRPARWAAASAGGAREETAGLWLETAAEGAVDTPVPRVGADGSLTVETPLPEGATLAVALGHEGARPGPLTVAGARGLLDRTLAAWHAWADRDPYGGRHGSAQVRRSALVLRGLMSSDTGALIAAPTTSLPEWPGGTRNWDYRYLWHRDAALVVLVLMRLGHRAEAGRYLRVLLRHCRATRGVLSPMLDLDGGGGIPETELGHLEGYRGSRPVRIGNDAEEQRQLDVYGQVLDAALVYQQVTKGTRRALDAEELAALFGVVDVACRSWREPDDGIWEVRAAPRHWTSSKLYLWVCLDRGIRLAELAGAAPPGAAAWRAERDALREDILTRGLDESSGAFVQSYGARTTDASLLRMPLLGFLPGDDPRVLATIERVEAELGEDGWLVHRYDPVATRDGIEGPEGGFLLCSFDMVSALVLAGRHEQARRRFEALCARAGRFGLFAEEMTADGTMLGNYPQAFTHLGLIEAAMNLDAAQDREALHAWAGRSAG
ncbi:glycoside hydrolase family 15 protein [Streptomyces marincola]|uniref:glycoside hydrolase family 15 protein n=1 Tax=Streptomyces marincola TaxID=2878388 RepID=UPI001CF2A391|nr:glycoside hydrolase family 15 protein [Streptomyces marincola]UCM88200.1 glycoside hydrolase family 15 protein [Streptomyces marincola]